MRSGQEHLIVVLLLSLLASGLSWAEENRWANSRGGGKWENGANWSLGVPPNSSHDVVIASALSETVTIDAITAAQADQMFALSLRVGRTGNLLTGTDTLSLLNAGLVQPLVVLGSTVISNRGAIRVTRSMLYVNDGLTLQGGSVMITSNGVLNVKGNNYPAYDFAVDGNVTLNSGSLNFSNFIASGMAIGKAGQGSLNVLGGEMRVGGFAFLDVGTQPGSVGSFSIAGGIARVEGQSFKVGGNAGSTGAVLVTGGELIVGDTTIGSGGQLIVSNGIWRANPPNAVSVASRGSLTLAGGTSVLSGALRIQSITNVPGLFFLTGATLLSTNGSVTIGGFACISNGVWRARGCSVSTDFMDPSGAGQLLFAGGSTTVAENLMVGSCGSFGKTGLVTVAGGELSVTNAALNATLRIDNGVFQLENGMVIVDTIDLTSPCARLERTGGTLIYRQALLDPSRDDDGDGLSNGLEQLNGLDPLNPASPDSDSDGASDVDELLSGTDRFNSNSVVRIISILPQGEDVRLRWQSVGGKTNIIQGADTLGGSNRFEDLATMVIPGAGGRTNTFIEPEGAIKGPNRFYRVKVIP